VFVLSLLPIALLYSVWLPASCRDKSAVAMYHVLESDDNESGAGSNIVDNSTGTSKYE